MTTINYYKARIKFGETAKPKRTYETHSCGTITRDWKNSGDKFTPSAETYGEYIIFEVPELPGIWNLQEIIESINEYTGSYAGIQKYQAELDFMEIGNLEFWGECNDEGEWDALTEGVNSTIELNEDGETWGEITQIIDLDDYHPGIGTLIEILYR